MITLQKLVQGNAATPAIFNAPLYMADTNFSELELAQSELLERVAALEDSQGQGGQGGFIFVDAAVELLATDATCIFSGTSPVVNTQLTGSDLFPDATEILVSILSAQYAEYNGAFQSFIWINDKKMGMGNSYYASAWGHSLNGIFIAPVTFLFRAKYAFPSTVVSIIARR